MWKNYQPWHAYGKSLQSLQKLWLGFTLCNVACLAISFTVAWHVTRYNAAAFTLVGQKMWTAYVRLQFIFVGECPTYCSPGSWKFHAESNVERAKQHFLVYQITEKNYFSCLLWSRIVFPTLTITTIPIQFNLHTRVFTRSLACYHNLYLIRFEKRMDPLKLRETWARETLYQNKKQPIY